MISPANLREDRELAAKLAERLRDNTLDTDEMLLSVAEHAKELAQQNQAILNTMRQLQETANAKADAAALQNVAMLTSGHLEDIRAEIQQLRQMDNSMTASKAGLQLDVRNGFVMWKNGNGDWQNLVALDRLRGPKGAPARGGGHTWRPNVDAEGILTWHETSDGPSPRRLEHPRPAGRRRRPGRARSAR